MIHGTSFFCMFAVMLSVLQAFGQQNEPPMDGTDMSLEELSSVKITVASKYEENICDAPGVISVVTKDELKRFGGTTLSDILKRVPSLLGSTIYLTDRSVISVRGDQIMTSSSHVLLLINGRPAREVLEGGIKSEMLESFPVNIIERIEVIRGPGSVLYGSQAFSGVINVVTKKPENNTVSVSGNYGEHNHSNIMADVQYKLGDLGLVFAGRYADKGNWNLNWKAPGQFSLITNNLTIPDFGPGFFGELTYKNFSLMGSYNEWNNQNFTPDIQWMADDTSFAAKMMGVKVPSDRCNWKKLFGDVGYKVKLNNWYSTTANVTFTRSWFTAYGVPWTERDAYELIGEWTNFFSPVQNLNVTLGGVIGYITGTEKDSKNKFFYKGGIYNTNHKENTFSGYAQVDYRLAWCKAIGGIQANKVRASDSLDHVDNFDADFNPRAGLIFYPLEHINIKTLYSTAYRAPSLNELYLDYPMMGGKMVNRPDITSWYPGHEFNLKPEKIYTFDVGANYQSEKVEFGINGFHSLMKNLISNRPVTPFFLVWDNIQETTIMGLECEGKYYLTKSIFFEGSFLYQQNKDRKTGEENIAPLPNFSAKGGLSYLSDFGLTVGAFNTFEQALDPKYDATVNTDKVTKFFNLANVHCSYDLNKLFQISKAKELSLVLNIDNLLNKEIWLPPKGCISDNRIPYNQGRTIYGGFKAAF
jgi:outer membrane receptor for ferrienterochelin and colicins